MSNTTLTMAGSILQATRYFFMGVFFSYYKKKYLKNILVVSKIILHLHSQINQQQCEL